MSASSTSVPGRPAGGHRWYNDLAACVRQLESCRHELRHADGSGAGGSELSASTVLAHAAEIHDALDRRNRRHSPSLIAAIRDSDCDAEPRRRMVRRLLKVAAAMRQDVVSGGVIGDISPTPSVLSRAMRNASDVDDHVAEYYDISQSSDASSQAAMSIPPCFDVIEGWAFLHTDAQPLGPQAALRQRSDWDRHGASPSEPPTGVGHLAIGDEAWTDQDAGTVAFRGERGDEAGRSADHDEVPRPLMFGLRLAVWTQQSFFLLQLLIQWQEAEAPVLGAGALRLRRRAGLREPRRSRHSAFCRPGAWRDLRFSTDLRAAARATS